MDGVTSFVARTVIAKAVSGEVLAADLPLSFWGGLDPERGQIIDRRHPLSGRNASGRVLVIPFGRGSCSGSGVLLEAIANGVAPAAIITSQIDPIISLGAVLGDELYGEYPAILVVTDEQRRQIATGDTVDIDIEGGITIRSGQ